MTVSTLDALANALETTPRWLHEGIGPEGVTDEESTVPLVGYVGAGATTHFFGDQYEHDRVRAPQDASDSTVAVEIRGDSLGLFYDGWIATYDNVRRPVTAELIGRLCVVGLDDGRVLIKKVQRSKTRGLFHLLSQTEAPILDVPIEWAARVTSLMPRR